MRHDQRYFRRLGQEDQRLKKHYGRWMDIVDHIDHSALSASKVVDDGEA